jgi:hypothetical protein
MSNDGLVTIGQASGRNSQWKNVQLEPLLCTNVLHISIRFESLASEYIFIADILDFFGQEE